MVATNTLLHLQPQTDITVDGEIKDYKMWTTHKLTVDFQKKSKMKSDIKNMPKQ